MMRRVPAHSSLAERRLDVSHSSFRSLTASSS